MTARKHDIGALPYWPRFLSRVEAARYLGVSPNLFDAEVAAGKWPAGLKRGVKAGIVTWDRVALDRRADESLELPSDDFETRRNAARRQPGRQAQA